LLLHVVQLWPPTPLHHRMQPRPRIMQSLPRLKVPSIFVSLFLSFDNQPAHLTNPLFHPCGTIRPNPRIRELFDLCALFP